MDTREETEGARSLDHTDQPATIHQGSDGSQHGISGRPVGAGVPESQAASPILRTKPDGDTGEQVYGAGGTHGAVPSATFYAVRHRIVDASDVTADNVVELETELYDELLEKLAGNPGLTALHWMLIRRACHHWAMATLFDDERNDRQARQLMEEPLRAIRTTAAIAYRYQARISEILQRSIPDPHQRRAAAEALLELEAE